MARQGPLIDQHAESLAVNGLACFMGLRYVVHGNVSAVFAGNIGLFWKAAGCDRTPVPIRCSVAHLAGSGAGFCCGLWSSSSCLRNVVAVQADGDGPVIVNKRHLAGHRDRVAFGQFRIAIAIPDLEAAIRALRLNRLENLQDECRQPKTPLVVPMPSR